jgi:aldehyde dehydrogenase (NAD+)
MSDAKFVMTIGGRAVQGSAAYEVVNPATEAVIGKAPNCTREELDQAVAAARAAFPAWSALTHEARQQAVRSIGKQLTENADALMRLLTAEQGKPHEDARAEVLASAFWCDAVANFDLPVIVNEDNEERTSETRRVPVGVVGGIVPWNYPILLGIWKIAPALLAGNTIIVKPSPFTPLTMLKIGQLMIDLLPPGVLNVISGGDELGPWLSEHPDIDKVSFTGSTATGKRVMASAATNLKRVTLELGGNDPAIVLADVNVATIVEELFWAAFRNTGQICIATKRLYIHEDIYDAVMAALVEYARQVKIGDGAQQGTQLGPIQNRRQFERVKSLIADSHTAGHSFAAGGEIPEGKGYFVPITIVDNPPEDSRVVKEEAFGPVLPLLKFKDIEEVLNRANDTIYGLAASVWSADLEAARAIAARLQAGTVWVNEVQHLTPFAVFAGHKQSGVGAENGLEGLLEYTNPQTVTIRKPRAGTAAPEENMVAA